MEITNKRVVIEDNEVWWTCQSSNIGPGSKPTSLSYDLERQNQSNNFPHKLIYWTMAPVRHDIRERTAPEGLERMGEGAEGLLVEEVGGLVQDQEVGAGAPSAMGRRQS